MTRSLRSFLVTLAGVAVLVAGCTTEDRTAGSLPPADRGSVVVLGDSITAMSAAEVEAGFRANGYSDVRVEAAPGRRIAVGDGTGEKDPLNGVARLQQLLQEGADPDLWVIELGSNDIAKYPSVEAYGELVDQLLLQIPDDAPVVWVNTWWQAYPNDAEMFNLALGRRIQERGNGVVADWWSLANTPDQQVVGFDGIHPTEAGRTALAMVMVAAAGRL